jgi:thiamine pyrophosphate-dependent acetolactate synthase large subunit-like protein
MKVYDAVAKAFIKEGVATVFGLLGDGQITWWSAMAAHPGVQMVDARDEGAALSMAEGWATATGKTGVCSVTQGPGISRTATSLITASRARTPIVIHTSRAPFNSESGSQHMDQERFVASTGAAYIEILTPSFAESAVRTAFYRARMESRPVVLSVPMDLQDKECSSEGDAYRPSSTMIARIDPVQPHADRVNEAVEIIRQSKRPVILIGSGAAQEPTLAASEWLATRIGALITTTLKAKGALAGSEFHAGISGWFSGAMVKELLRQADCLIAVGASLNAFTISADGELYSHARVIQIDVARHIVMGNGRGADCYIHGNAELTLQSINRLVAEKAIAGQGYRTAAIREALLEATCDRVEFEIEPGVVDPRDAAKALDEALPANVALVTGNAHYFSFPVLSMRRQRAFQLYVTAFGCIGQALGVAIGVGVGARRAVVCIDGDGSAMQNIQELDTAARLGLKLLFVIFNDEAYGAEFHKLRAKGLNPALSVVRSPDFATVAQGFGCRGRVARTVKEIAAAAKEFMDSHGPMLLDIRVSRNVLSVPYRRLGRKPS